MTNSISTVSFLSTIANLWSLLASTESTSSSQLTVRLNVRSGSTAKHGESASSSRSSSFRYVVRTKCSLRMKTRGIRIFIRPPTPSKNLRKCIKSTCWLKTFWSCNSTTIPKKKSPTSKLRSGSPRVTKSPSGKSPTSRAKTKWIKSCKVSTTSQMEPSQPSKPSSPTTRSTSSVRESTSSAMTSKPLKSTAGASTRSDWGGSVSKSICSKTKRSVTSWSSTTSSEGWRPNWPSLSTLAVCSCFPWSVDSCSKTSTKRYAAKGKKQIFTSRLLWGQLIRVLSMGLAMGVWWN